MNPLRRGTDGAEANSGTHTPAQLAFAAWWAGNKNSLYPLRQEQAWRIFLAGWWARQDQR